MRIILVAAVLLLPSCATTGVPLPVRQTGKEIVKVAQGIALRAAADYLARLLPDRSGK